MKRKIIIINIIIFSYINAMEQQPLCLLKYLPLVILDYIATFLDDVETEQEFIERTRTIVHKEIPEWCSNLIFPRQFGMALTHTYCPDKDYIAIMQSTQKEIPPIIHSRYSIYQTLFIIDRKKRAVIHKQDLGNRGYKNIALSCNAHSFGITHIEFDFSGDLCTDVIQYKTLITLGKSRYLLQKAKMLELYKHENFLDFVCPSIAFNKQGTHLIAHYTKCDSEHKPIKYHHIIPLTHQEMMTDKTLAGYFLQRRVCKDFMKQITL